MVLVLFELIHRMEHLEIVTNKAFSKTKITTICCIGRGYYEGLVNRLSINYNYFSNTNI